MENLNKIPQDYIQIVEERMFLTGKSAIECLYMNDDEVEELAYMHLYMNDDD